MKTINKYIKIQIQPAYVREAYRLLQKSIIFVESEDIELDENEEVSYMKMMIYVCVI